MNTKIPVRRVNHKLLRLKLEQTLRDAIKDRDATLVLMAKAQLRQYKEQGHG